MTHDHHGVVERVRFALVITSESVKKGLVEDKITPIVEERLKKTRHELVYRVVVGNNIAEIQLAVLEAIVRHDADVVLVTGGTGPRPSDVSVDAVEKLAERRIPGIGEEFRRRSLEVTPTALLSRADAYIVHGRVVIVSPGSPSAVEKMLDIALPIIGHLVYELRRG